MSFPSFQDGGMLPGLLSLALLTAAPDPPGPPRFPSLRPAAQEGQARLPVLSRGKRVQPTRAGIREYLEYDDSDRERSSRAHRKGRSNPAWAAATQEARCPWRVRPDLDIAMRPAAVPLITILCTLLL
jgi:hypothetical protein